MDVSKDIQNEDSTDQVRKVLILFNFCHTPLNKNNIFKVNVEILNKFLLKDALLDAIEIHNKTHEQKLLDKPQKYKIRLSKKSGMPDMDLPSVSENLKLNETNYFNFSVIVEVEHLIILPKKKFDPSNNALKSLNTSATFKESLIFDEKSRSALDAKENRLVENKSSKNGCCNAFKKMFSRK